MQRNYCGWKGDWSEVQQYFINWWEHRGALAGQWTPPGRSVAKHPGWEFNGTLEGQDRLNKPLERAKMEMSRLAHMDFPGDTLPCTALDFGPSSLCIYLGSEPHWEQGTVWYDTVWEELENPETTAPLRFDPENRWWKITEALYSSYHQMADGKVLTPICPIGNGIDVLASLRGTQTLLLDMIDQPEWVQKKLREINAVWFEVYERLYQLSKQPDDSSAWDAFRLWGPGRVALLQCDFSAMISSDMFREFVVPGLREICSRMDYSMFHLDGRECLGCLDAVLEIEELDAVEWSPGAGRPDGASPVHYEMYKKILNAGKSLQITDANIDDTIPLLEELGGKGVYVIYRDTQNLAAAEALQQQMKKYR